ncbi:hypothetical protein DFJ43DRAFT_584037 [Lentinula guzmanii]|uniref:Uncharacterized protein n=1 Tax=Lentinula guzmanii TaxID=2804957 RepID=A0AA38J5N5_9AGAR|nr:hypothetical protein DFJ43DRAFT_584037 [Lentinula guzmanii]KAJ3797391.1 hypothetical protein GGU11DRAFT_79881 [Lentinula aff. detonsa]
MNTIQPEPEAKVVRFDDATTPSVTKHSRPLRKKSKIPTFNSPHAYVIVLPFDDMLARAKKEDPDVQKAIDERGVWKEVPAVHTLVAGLCDQIDEIWPNVFIVLVDHKSFPTSQYCLGFADNTHHSNRRMPTAEEIQEIRDLLDLNGPQFKLGWYRDLYPDNHS